MTAFAAHFDDNQVPTQMGVVGTLGTADESGTAKSIPIGVDPATGAQYVNILAGSINIGTIAEELSIASGTLTVLPQISVGTLPQVSVGTLPTVTLADYGTNVNVVSGTQQTIGTVGVVNNGTLAQVTTVSNVTNGSVNVLTGTVTRVSNIGTVESGTFQLNPNPTVTPLNFGTLGTAGGSFFATISAASGAGTYHYIQGVDIVVQSGTPDVRVLAGTSIAGTGVLAAGKFVPGGGIAKTWSMVPFKTGTNSELTYHFVGAGTAFINVNYWKGI